MNTLSDNLLVGKGLYSSREASRLTGVPIWSIRRWSQGYSYVYRGSRFYSEPAVATDIGRIDSQIVLSFADLMELRVLNQFLKYGVSWKTIRIAFQKARNLFSVRHPFSTSSFRTDKRTILLETASDLNDEPLLDLLRDQYEWNAVLAPYLMPEDVDFRDDRPLRWWPAGRSQEVVIDPSRSFGAPIVSEAGIQTSILRRSYSAENSFETVASWFQISEHTVKKAVEFEDNLAA